MFVAARLKLLQEQKQRLLDQSQACRAEWIVTWQRIDQRLGWLDRALAVVRRVLPFSTPALVLWNWWKSRSTG